MPKNLFWPDRPILDMAEDRFDFSDYAEALGQIVLSGNTPLTVGIFGPWGSGKTSLMRLIIKRLQGRRTTHHRRAHIIWFNAWQYERDETAIWRMLLFRVLEGLRTLDLTPQDRQQIEDWETRLYSDVNRTERGSWQVDWPQLGKGALQLGLSLAGTSSGLLALLNLANDEMSTIEDVVKAVHRKELEIHRRQLTMIEEFQDGLAKLIQTYIWERNGVLVIFVDDLDRCLPDRALDVLETIKLFLDVPGGVFFLAADHERIEDVVQQRYGSQDVGVGESYLEKLVQLPFYLPPMEESQMLRFIANAAPGLPAEVHQVFAYGLPSNPRLLKRILNIYRLIQELAERRIARGTLEEVDPVLLAKIVVVQGRYRRLYQDLLEYPSLIQQLELKARRADKLEAVVIPGMEAVPALVDKYADQRPLMRILRIGSAFAPLTQLEIGSYLHLTLPTGQEQALHLDPNQQLWNDLLSCNPTRIKAATDTVRQRDMQAKYALALVKVLHKDRHAPLSERLSAAWSLELLGDPRNFDEIIAIPGGEFLYGKEKLPYYLLPYRIARYPVTNRQYARFLQEYPDFPVPRVTEEWGRAYNWDPVRRTYPAGKGNYPVLLVTWDEAQAYCAWVGGRLPTQQEWERAARGTDGRRYPWGDTFDPLLANTRESGLGSPTPVGIFTAGQSPDGLYDMAGNVWEWTSDEQREDIKIIRGGAWNFPADSAQTFAHEISRPGNRANCIGFRVAFDPEPRDQEL